MSNTDKKVDILKQAAEYILSGKTKEAGALIKEKFPFIPIRKETRSYSAHQQMKQFFKDGFIDRYFGTKLINPGMLRIFSEKLPGKFTVQMNGETFESHVIYRDFQPSMDQIVPITRGGKNDSSNWVTTSMKGNLAKKNYTLDQLRWHLFPGGNIHQWEGLSELFVAIVEKEPELLQIDRINFWYKATKKVMKKYKDESL